MAEALSFEVFGTGRQSPEDLWALVGDPRRLPEWTDADQVDPGAELAEGAQIGVMVDGSRQTWTVLTAGDRIWEASARVPAGELALGARVAADPQGSRLVLACRLDPAGSRLRARLLTLPRIRARCDRWIASALGRAREDR